MRNKYEIIQQYFYRDFKITICFFLKKNGQKDLTAFIRNKKWLETEFIILTDLNEKNLRKKVSSFLKKPDLREENISNLGIKVFIKSDQNPELRNFPFVTDKSLIEEARIEEELRWAEDSALNWTQEDEDWSNGITPKGKVRP